MRTTNYLLLSLLLALSVWACRASDTLSGSYVLVAIEAQDLPASVPNTRFQVSNGSLGLSDDGSFVLSYGANLSGSVWGSFMTVVKGSYDLQNGQAIEFESSEQTVDGSPVEADHSFIGTVQGDSLTLTDPNNVDWMFRKVQPQQLDEQAEVER